MHTEIAHQPISDQLTAIAVNSSAPSPDGKSKKRHKPFEIQRDGNRKYYIRIPEHLRKEIGKKIISKKIRAQLEPIALAYRTKYADRLYPSYQSKLEAYMDECGLYGYHGTQEDIIREKRDQLKALSQEKTLEEIQEDFAVSLENAGSHDQANHVRQLELPWVGKKLGEFTDWVEEGKAIIEVETFIATQYNFLNGEPWSAATRDGWISRFCLIGDHAVRRRMTPLKTNFFRGALYRMDIDISPVIFSLERLQEFMTFVRYWLIKEYVGLVLGTWGCIRVEEITQMLGEMIDLTPGAGKIDLPASITKTKHQRTIYESDNLHLFTLLREVADRIPKGKEKIMETGDWKNHLFFAYRELYAEPWPSNIMRSTGASMLLVYAGMQVCGQVMGHLFEGVDEILLDWYREHVSRDTAQRFMTMVPEPWSPELEARYMWKLYKGWIDTSLSTHMWPNYSVQGQHTIGMGSEKMDGLIRRKRPIYAVARGKTIEIRIAYLDGSTATNIVPCRTEKIAKKKTHKIQVASYTGQGVINVNNGDVAHYERNYGPCLGQKLWALTNGDLMEKQMKVKRMNLKAVARAVGTSIDLVHRYFTMGAPGNRIRFMPETTKIKLEALFTGLEFKEAAPPSPVMRYICDGAPELPT